MCNKSGDDLYYALPCFECVYCAIAQQETFEFCVLCEKEMIRVQCDPGLNYYQILPRGGTKELIGSWGMPNCGGVARNGWQKVLLRLECDQLTTIVCMFAWGVHRNSK